MRTLRKSACAVITWCWFAFRALADHADIPRRRLNYRTSNDIPNFSTFKIVQFTDIHLGEPYSDKKDPQTFTNIETVLTIDKPDLIVLSGDMLTSDVIQYNADEYFEQLTQVLEPYNTSWCLLFGNHDVAYYRYDYTTYQKPNVRRTTLARTDQAHPLSLTQVGPQDVFGKSNYWLDIFDDSDTFVASRLLILDTGGGMLPSKIDATQVDWFQATNDPSIASFCFQHLPTVGMIYSQDKCTGETLTGMIDPIDNDAGMTQAMEDAGNVGFVAVGHNHGNSYCCPFDADNRNNRWSQKSYSHMHYCFGRHSGYGGAAAFTEHGARIYELGYDHATGKVHWRSFVRTELGRVIDEFYPA